MATKILEAIIPAASLQGLTANQSYWLSLGAGAGSTDPVARTGVLSSTASGGTGFGSSLTTVEPPGGGNSAWWDFSLWSELNIWYSSGAQIGSVGLTLNVIELWPNELHDANLYVAQGALVPAVNLSAAAITAGVMRLGQGLAGAGATSWRTRRAALGFAATTWPTTGANVYLSVWGIRDGQDRQRG